ncbi:MAG: benzoyl-CoA reductase subunit D [Deltaproteobacteria bacterium]|nr:benzoyl-CoA reductase subunit D [Deltaproteobacteria bacterium]
MILTAGIDVGTSAVKVALIESPPGGGRERPGAKARAQITERIRRRDPKQVLELAFEQAIEAAGVKRGDLDYIATTGEGEIAEFRTGHFYGMTAHARGALFLDPETRGVVDAGALHGRAIRFDERAKVLDYRMTSQCASGSGQFLENIARYLGVVLEEIGPLSLKADKPEKISGICAVLAETDVINMVSRGITMPNILKGIHSSMGVRFVKLLKSIKVRGPVMLTGGLSADVGLLAAMKESLVEQNIDGVDMRAHKDGVYAGALGAALWGAYRFERLKERRAA